MTVPSFERAEQTEKLVEVLRTASIGEVVTYATLSDAIGETIQSRRHYLQSATRILEAEGVVFGTVTGLGVKRLAAADLPKVGQTAIERTRRTARRGSKRLGLVDRMNDVEPEILAAIRVKRSLLNLLAYLGGASNQRKAEAEVRATTGPVPPMKLLEAFKK